MAMLKGSAIAFLVSCVSCYLISVPSLASSDEFLQCLREKIPSELVYAQSSSNFTDVLVSSIKNPKFFTNATVKPVCIVTPSDASHVQAAVLCGRKLNVRLRVRSGGHDYEGLSYRSACPYEVFGVVDLAKLRAVSVNQSESTAWVGSGATIGELYYAIAKNNSQVAFPAGECPTIGVGGHFSGGGVGMIMRKHGLSIDKVVDAKLVNANGELLDRAGMGEDLFWAIRGGGGGSFGVVLSWKVQLVQVPPTVTVFSIGKTLEQGAIDILTKWQDVGPSLPSDLNLKVKVQGQEALFMALYLGTCSSLVSTMDEQFPELNMTSTDCRTMTWLESAALSFTDMSSTGTVEDALLSRAPSMSIFTKGKSDYVRRAISKDAWKSIFSWFAMNGSGLIMLEPHGGFMDTVPAAATPYPHRCGVLYVIQYIVFWQGDGGAPATTWLAKFYDFMGHHVSKKPRQAYVNFRDLDIGQNPAVVDGNVSTFESGKAWGERYFMDNYHRLASVKAAVDPTDYFRNEQSVPPLLHGSK
ncbi:berberine bridge enzyme-like Cyn d 4 [Lolium rigidum]|uniref:berberine bridge enzyme-like Cyn d 4 n=1 Tax=Lolium rigidum TaxID=89674 RepID=UPI001F5DD574|nr:berberine bridge enzyme-like Cyn d 4 [Lolium rigidum]